MDELETIFSRLELRGFSLRISCEPHQGWEVSARVEHNAFAVSCDIDMVAAARGLEQQLSHRTPPSPYVPQKAAPIRPTIDPESLL